MTSSRDIRSIEIGQKRITWDLSEGQLMSAGSLAVILWLNPSLRQILKPLVEELGVPLFRLLIAYHSNLGAELDYRAVVGNYESLELGFQAWSNTVVSSGWGKIELKSCEPQAQCAWVDVLNPWELQMQGDMQEIWGCPFMLGKIIGIFSLAFGVPCWADELNASIHGSTSHVEFKVYPSSKTIASELDALRRAQKQLMRRRLAEMSAELAESDARQRALITSLGEIVYTLSTEGRLMTLHIPMELAHLLGLPEKMVGRLLEEVFPEEIAVQLKAAIALVRASNTTQTLIYERRLEGETRYINAKMSGLFGENGEFAGVSVIERDLTELVLAERTLKERLALIERQRETIRAISTPILEVWDRTLALPIQGALDEQRLAAIVEDLLAKVVKVRARVVIIDLTGVDWVDDTTTLWFAKIVRAVELLGAECLLCGIRPPVARAISELDTGMGAEKYFQTMRSALAAVLRRGNQA